MEKLTSKQQNVYDYIRECFTNGGYTPTMREIADYFGYSSTNTVNDHLLALAKKGYITRKPGAARGILLTENNSISQITNTGVPIIGRVAAGTPISAIENLDGYLELSEFYDERHFALHVKGDSMIDAGIWDGDFVIVREQQVLSNGDIGVALVEGEATVKRISIKQNEAILYPENEYYSPIRVDLSITDFRIAGKVVGLHRVIR